MKQEMNSIEKSENTQLENNILAESIFRPGEEVGEESTSCIPHLDMYIRPENNDSPKATVTLSSIPSQYILKNIQTILSCLTPLPYHNIGKFTSYRVGLI